MANGKQNREKTKLTWDDFETYRSEAYYTRTTD